MTKSKTPEAGHNRFDPKQVSGFVGRIENLMDQLDSEKGEFMRKARTIRDDVKIVLSEAKDQGIPKKELRAVIKARDLQDKLQSVREDLEDQESQDTYDELRFALGDLADTALGVATLAAHRDAPRPQA